MYPDRPIGCSITEEWSVFCRTCRQAPPTGGQTAATFGRLLHRSRSSGSSSVPTSHPDYAPHYQSPSVTLRPHYFLFAFVSDRQEGKSESSQSPITHCTRSDPTLHTKHTAPAAARPHEHALVSENFRLQQNCGTDKQRTACTVQCHTQTHTVAVLAVTLP